MKKEDPISLADGRLAPDRADDAGTEWARYKGAPVHVSGLPKVLDERPTCLVCSGILIAHRGAHRAWHFAHHAGGPECALWSRETKLHFTTKMRLRAALLGSSMLHISLGCGMPGHVGPAQTEREWVSGWNNVVCEVSVGSLRPDVLLLRDNVPIGAIEVVVSHPVSPEKLEKIRELQVPWIEVAAGRVPETWTAAEPLPANWAEPEGWTCDACKAALADPEKKEQEKSYWSVWQETWQRIRARSGARVLFERQFTLQTSPDQRVVEDFVQVVELRDEDGALGVAQICRRDGMLIGLVDGPIKGREERIQQWFRDDRQNWRRRLAAHGVRFKWGLATWIRKEAASAVGPLDNQSSAGDANHVASRVLTGGDKVR